MHLLRTLGLLTIYEIFLNESRSNTNQAEIARAWHIFVVLLRLRYLITFADVTG
jgi:hypothetical protein